MAVTATVRDLRNRFPAIKKLVEDEGEVVVTDHGTPRYKLTLYRPARSAGAPPPKDYLARLRRHQPSPMKPGTTRSLDDENRGGR
jgi:antitoxin (DNA-binding transcriptional repressor) of toxin-antitoxin stability system